MEGRALVSFVAEFLLGIRHAKSRAHTRPSRMSREVKSTKVLSHTEKVERKVLELLLM